MPLPKESQCLKTWPRLKNLWLACRAPAVVARVARPNYDPTDAQWLVQDADLEPVLLLAE